MEDATLPNSTDTPASETDRQPMETEQPTQNIPPVDQTSTPQQPAITDTSKQPGPAPAATEPNAVKQPTPASSTTASADIPTEPTTPSAPPESEQDPHTPPEEPQPEPPAAQDRVALLTDEELARAARLHAQKISRAMLVKANEARRATKLRYEQLVLEAIQSRGETSLPVICNAVDLSPSRTSSYVCNLVKSGKVVATGNGQSRRYRAASPSR